MKAIKIAAAFAIMMLSAVANPALAQSAGWSSQVARVIASKQVYPRTAQMRGEEGTAKVRVFISASGTVERTEMVTPTGSATLDKEALALPARAGALPAPPNGPTSLVIPITWKLL